MRRHSTSQNIDWLQPVNWDHPLNRGLVAWYLAIQNQPGWGSSKWLDLTDPVHGNHGTLTNMDPATDWVASSSPGGFGAIGLADTGLESAGTSQLINVPITRFASNSPFSYFCWVYPIAFQNFAGVGGHLALAGFSGWSMYCHGDQTVGTYLGSHRRSTATIALNAWSYVGATYDGSNLILWINGNSVRSDSGVIYTGHTFDEFSVGGFYVVSDPASPGDFVGSLNDARLYDRALWADEVSDYYHLSQQGYPGLLNRTDSRFYSLPSGGVTPWYYMRQPSRIIGSGIGA